jgi:small subunit ribosomal protein S13
MARISGIDLPKNKRLEVALTYLYGIGRPSSKKICSKLGIDFNLKTDQLGEDQIVSLRKLIESDYKIEGDLRRATSTDIKRLMDIGSYRGLRHRRGLPVRGQRTSTNARTRKGPRKQTITKKKAV